MDNLFARLPPSSAPEEEFRQLLAQPGLRIERIVSRGHASPKDFWYDQEQDEWVLLVQGAARLAFADGDEVRLGSGDWLLIPAHRKHRVAWTVPEAETVWLAVHYSRQ